FIPLLFAVIMISLFTACSYGNKYNATVTCKRYSELSGVLKDDFLQDNRLSGAYYNTAAEGEEENYEKYTDYYSPPLRSLLIKTQAEYDEIFMTQLIAVNFENQMLAICSWSRLKSDTDYEKTRISRMQIVEANKDTPNYSTSLLIVFKRDFSKNSNETDIDVQEYAFVVLDKLDVDGVHFSVG
ncbi:MAG: hypothetical protein K2I17_02820, partial [Clostridia bacterium]|nr:hypothetical protein [Clostridia bacterium]